jgi:hypothetical protein
MANCVLRRFSSSTPERIWPSPTSNVVVSPVAYARSWKSPKQAGCLSFRSLCPRRNQHRSARLLLQEGWLERESRARNAIESSHNASALFRRQATGQIRGRPLGRARARFSSKLIYTARAAGSGCVAIASRLSFGRQAGARSGPQLVESKRFRCIDVWQGRCNYSNGNCEGFIALIRRTDVRE